MKAKLFSLFFNTISWAVWGSVILFLCFTLFLFVTGERRQPTFTVNEVAVRAVDAADPALAENGKRGADWFCADVSGEIRGAALSPFTYRAGRFELSGSGELRYGHDHFVVLDAPLHYSKNQADDFVISLYIRSPEGEQALLEALREARFGLRQIDQDFAFLTKRIMIDMPYFELSDHPELFA